MQKNREKKKKKEGKSNSMKFKSGPSVQLKFHVYAPPFQNRQEHDPVNWAIIGVATVFGIALVMAMIIFGLCLLKKEEKEKLTEFDPMGFPPRQRIIWISGRVEIVNYA